MSSCMASVYNNNNQASEEGRPVLQKCREVKQNSFAPTETFRYMIGWLYMKFLICTDKVCQMVSVFLIEIFYLLLHRFVKYRF